MLTPPFTIHGLCGTTPPLWQAQCPCDSCRRATASPMTSFLGVADGCWAWTGALPQTSQSSPGIFRDVCPTCGTPMACRTTRLTNQTPFTAATLDDLAAFTPTHHDHADERLPWLPLADALPRV